MWNTLSGVLGTAGNYFQSQSSADQARAAQAQLEAQRLAERQQQNKMSQQTKKMLIIGGSVLAGLVGVGIVVGALRGGK